MSRVIEEVSCQHDQTLQHDAIDKERAKHANPTIKALIAFKVHPYTLPVYVEAQQELFNLFNHYFILLIYYLYIIILKNEYIIEKYLEILKGL